MRKTCGKTVVGTLTVTLRAALWGTLRGTLRSLKCMRLVWEHDELVFGCWEFLGRCLNQ